jgi:hypothetical protein
MNVDSLQQEMGKRTLEIALGDEDMGEQALSSLGALPRA